MLSQDIDWIAADWSATELRVWAMGVDGKILAKTLLAVDTNTLTSDGFESALLGLIHTWLDESRAIPIIASGLIGGKNGWIDVALRSVPCQPVEAGHLQRVPLTDPRIAIYVIGGLVQNKPLDLMQGQETQIFGFLAQQPKFDGVLCIPGFQTRWAHISAEEVVSFQSFMTGELLGLLQSHSSLQSIQKSTNWDQNTFNDAVSESLSKPERIAAKLHGLHAELQLGIETHSIDTRLTGYIVGLELAAAKPYWLGQAITVIGKGVLSNAYVSALKSVGALPQIFDAHTATIAGLARTRLEQKHA